MKKISKITALILSLLTVFSVSLTSFASSASDGNIDLENLEGLNPYIYISSYEITEGSAQAGETFTLRVNVSNANTTTDAYNVMASFFFTGSESFYLPSGMTNQHYIQYIAAGTTVPIDITLKVKDEFTLPSVTTEFVFTYYSSDRVYYSNNTSIHIQQSEKTELQLDLVKFPSEISTNEQTQMTFNVKNSGMLDIKDAVITISGDFVGSPMTIDYAELDFGSDLSIDKYFVFNNVGVTTVTLNAEYKSETGETFTTEEQVYQLEIAESSDTLENDDSEELVEESDINIFNGNSFWFYIMVAVGALVALIILTLIVKLIMSKKRK